MYWRALLIVRNDLPSTATCLIFAFEKVNRQMKLAAFLILLALFGSAIADEKITKPYQHKEGYFESTIPFQESEFSKWHILSDTQRIFDGEKNMMWIYQEGRNHKGVVQMRWVKRKWPHHSTYYIYSMLTHDQFYAMDMKYHKQGLKRISMQVFIDAGGTARHQAVWFKQHKPKKVAEDKYEADPDDGTEPDR